MSKKKPKPDRSPLRWDGMTAKQLRAVGKYLRDLADKIGLRDWMFHVMHDPADVGDDGLEAAGARVETIEGRKVANVWLAREWNTFDREKQRLYLVHELLHVHHRDQYDLIRLTLPPLLGQPAYTALWEMYRQTTEVFMDAVSYGVAAGFPLPPKP